MLCGQIVCVCVGGGGGGGRGRPLTMTLYPVGTSGEVVCICTRVNWAG